jgi:hypothetical protein
MEVVVALGLVTVMALAIIGIFSRLMSRSAISADQAAGQLLAQAVLDAAVRVGPPGWGGTTGSREVATADASSDTVYNYTVAATELVDSRHDLGRVFRVTVTVDWSHGETKRQNSGRMSVRRSRLAYVELASP